MADPKRLQKDGWGLAWFDSSTAPHVLKSPRPIFRDQPHLVGSTKKIQSSAMLGHIRAASNPMKMPRREILGYRHTQPFSFQRWTFVHNGTLNIPEEVKAQTGHWADAIKGNNDSEVLFYWIAKHVVFGKGRLERRVKKSVRALNQLWLKVKGRYPQFKQPYHGLNWVLSNGTTLIAFCYVSPNGWGKGRGLLSKSQRYFQMRYRRRGDELLVASEPLDRLGRWKRLRHGQLLVATKKGSSVAVKLSSALGRPNKKR